MLVVRERWSACRTIEDWAISLLLEEGAIKQCPDHGYIQCRSDPHARASAIVIACETPPQGLSAEDGVAALHDVRGGVGDCCPEC